MKKRKILSIILIAALIVDVLLCGTVIAYMFRQTEYKDNQFTPAQVSCSVSELFDGVKKTSIQVQNTGNIDAYLRVRLVSYWVRITENGMTEIVAKPSVMPQINIASGWIPGSNNTYYYQSAVDPNAFTGNLLSSAIQLEKDDDGYLQVIEVFAEAIQSEPKNAVTDSWRVTVDSNGNITDAL